jgi:hypothetical protein
MSGIATSRVKYQHTIAAESVGIDGGFAAVETSLVELLGL